MKQIDTITLKESPSVILNTPLLNKGTAFTQQERDELGLNGLLPSRISTVDEQIERCYANFQRRRTPIGQYDYLMGLMSRNEFLFYQFIARHPAEMLPIIYTPTVGEAALQYSNQFFQQRGLYLSYPLREHIETIINQYPHDEIQVIVATDGERILGLGDQGIGGMTIPIGKLSLYTLFGGIHPAKTLPILLDVGTNNPDYLKDPLYLGWRHPRISEAEYDLFIDRFIRALRKKYPRVLLQWEDFGKNNARRLLDKYRTSILSFNDDIQGTAAVTLSALLAAIRKTQQSLAAQTFALLGGGSAGTGIADMLVIALMAEGFSREEACNRIYIVDIDGLIHFNTPHVSDAQKPFSKSQALLRDWKIQNPAQISMHDVVVNAHPTALIGVSAQGGAFNQELIEEMTRHVRHPIVFPLSNPTSKAECTPRELVEWTQGRAIIATGSPFQPVDYQGKNYQIAQCNNVYIFPGIGLGALAARATSITDGMFIEAAKTLSLHSPALKDPTASLFPPVAEVRSVSRLIAIEVAKRAISDRVSKISPSEIEKRIDSLIWEPHYPRYTR